MIVAALSMVEAPAGGSEVPARFGRRLYPPVNSPPLELTTSGRVSSCFWCGVGTGANVMDDPPSPVMDGDETILASGRAALKRNV